MSQTPDPSISPNSDSQVSLKLCLDPPSPATEAPPASSSDPVPQDPGDHGECLGHEPPVEDSSDAHTSSTGAPASTDSLGPTEPPMPAEPPALPEPPTVGEIVDGRHDAQAGTAHCTSPDAADAQPADVRSPR